MDNKEVDNSLGEEPLFTDEKGNTFFPQEESDHVVRQRIKEEKRLAESKKIVPVKPRRKNLGHSSDNSWANRGIGKYISHR